MFNDAIQSDSLAQASLLSPALTTEMLDRLRQHPPLKLGVLASGSGSNFEAIAQAIADQQLNAHIQVVVYNNPGAKAADRAAKFGIPAVLHNHRDYAQREDLDRAIIQTFQDYDATWLIMAGWMRRVTQVLIDAFPQRCLNIHPSLLPSFPGTHAVEQALAAGVAIAGCTVHRVELKVDSGPIIMQAAVPILPGDSADTLHPRVQVQEHRLYPAAIALAAWQNLQNGQDI
ncbi:MAG: phosphoribosylglycinamide formyltransferase [Synechococcales cyanobacterium K44_A2020_017]|jgi:phosphoribosylglycinamide formyltransferase-1|nr:phosphoribosylglycinamide formyltransferase [Synechococcales cyanobacterium K32_A2020_035]MBF2093135.1 phosphoribosylglycinamide formyltransferase [Synechococcales cyanobacterium K44_A2020_017]